MFEKRMMESLNGRMRLNGCELERLVPKTSVAFMEPDIVIVPYAAVVPGATVPS
jgi:hypothetical protein